MSTLLSDHKRLGASSITGPASFWGNVCAVPVQAWANVRHEAVVVSGADTGGVVGLSGEDYAAFTAVATKSEVSLSWVIRRTICRLVQGYGVHPDSPLTLAGKRSKREGAQG